MSEFEGEDAVELFTFRAKEANCNNNKLLKRLKKETKRACLPSSTASNTEGPLYEMLPTVDKIQRALEPGEVLRSLCCHCRLCGNEDDDESVHEFDQMVSNGNIFRPDNIKGLAGLIFCGCLFALKAFSSTQCEDRTTQNVPIILQQRISPVPSRRDPNVSVSFYLSKIEPGCARLRGHEDKDLFRKVYDYRPDENDYIQRAILEANIAIKLAERNHGSIAHVLLAFHRKDSNRHYIELMFPKYLSDLGKLFSGSYTPSEPQSTQNHTGFDHPLWKAAIDVVDALAVMHDAINKGEIDCNGHFDIKPANILIKEYGKEVTLLLADFGEAAGNRSGTQDHKPPERDAQDDRNVGDLTKSYDIWSMACVLLQVCIYITKGQGGIESFNADRFRPDSSNPEFWHLEANGRLGLRPSVTAELKAIERLLVEDTRTRTIVATLRLMFKIDPTKRPTAAACLGYLTCPRNQNLVHKGLQDWNISYTATERSPPIRATLWLYRDQRNRADRAVTDEEITLNNQLVKFETKAIKEVYFIPPRAFFDSGSNTQSTFACCFQNLHDGVTFHFTRLDQYLDFIRLMTYQKIMPAECNNLASGMQIRVSRTSIRTKGKFIFSDTSKFIGALWTKTNNMANQLVCVVIDIGTKALRVEIPENSTIVCLTQLRNTAFRGAVLKALNNEGIPGFPISPDLLSTKLHLQLEKVKITFEGPQDRENFVTILKNGGILK
ncbi:kinase-like domain-containing protein [Ilyonectria robusta]|uniref:kinase-like domain-containing protein n=1 Tax=Ilyonectria robusta TaxID=1079257 RepID=UPI001E8C9E2E|nr:kinase-like domain-containing protein [Ilyonectria robusta]KAH8673162.1 kinase-like domain-containing protein [Ilyonectria robusta]